MDDYKDDFDIDGHNPTVYGSRAEMRWFEAHPFENDQDEPD